MHAVQCHGVGEGSVLLLCALMTVSAQKGLGDYPGQPSHLAAESDPRGDRGLPRVTGQSVAELELKPRHPDHPPVPILCLVT